MITADGLSVCSLWLYRRWLSIDQLTPDVTCKTGAGDFRLHKNNSVPISNPVCPATFDNGRISKCIKAGN